MMKMSELRLEIRKKFLTVQVVRHLDGLPVVKRFGIR